MAIKANWGAKHGPVWGALNAAIGASLFTLVSDWFGTAPWLGSIVGLAVGGCAYGAARHAKLHRQSAAWRAAAWVLVGFWTWWARAHETTIDFPFFGPHAFWWATGGSWMMLFVLFLIAAVGGKWLAGRPEDPAEVQAREARKQQLALAERYNARGDSREEKIADEWEERIARVAKIGTIEKVKVADLAADPSGNTKIDLIDPRTGKPVKVIRDGVEIYQIDFWKDDNDAELTTWNPRKKIWENNGFTFEGVFPQGGYSWRDLSGTQMANDARLPAGCTVRFTAGEDRGTFRGHVQLVNVLDKPRPYPTDFSQKSVLDGVHLGYEEHGAEKRLNMAGHNTTNAGAPESGKTNCANVVGMRLVETVDTLIFDYDIAGGGVTAPFLPAAWLAGDYDTAPQPGVAAAGPVVELAWILSEIGVKLIGGRKKGYQSIKVDGKVPIGHCLDKACGCGGQGVPLVMHRVDEGWSLYKAGEVGRMTRYNLEWIAGEGRPGACRVFYGALGSTDEYIPNGVQNIAPNRIALRQPNETEISRFLGWGKDFDADIFTKAGNAAVRDHEENLGVVKLLHLSSEKIIRQGVTECSKRRPVLDPVSEAIANDEIRIEHPQLVAYFRGKVDVVENGRYAQTGDKHWMPDGTLTIKNYWKNRWLFILPEMFPDRFGDLMRDAMLACGQTPGETPPAIPAPDGSTPERQTITASGPAGASTGGNTAMSTNPSPQSMAGQIHALRQSDNELQDALAAGEAAAAEADRRYAEKQAELAGIQGALDGEGEEDGDPARTSTGTLPLEVTIPDTVDGLPPEFQWRPEPVMPAPTEPPAPPTVVAPQNAAPKLAGDPEKQRLLVLGYVVDAAADGLSVKPLLQRLMGEVSERDGGEPYTLTEVAFRKSRLAQLVNNGLVHQPYAAADEDLFAEDGGKKSHWVATDLGVRYWEKSRGKVGK